MDQGTPTSGHSGIDFKSLIRSVIEDFAMAQAGTTEPAYKTELLEERRRREQLEAKMNDLVAENTKSKMAAEAANRSAQIRAELSTFGVVKVDLVFRIIKDDIQQAANGSLVASTPNGDVSLHDYLARFLNDNPEFLPARIAGGSGLSTPSQTPLTRSALDVDQIRPGMSGEQLQSMREQISQVAAKTLRGE
jgi:hypothetical protein